MRGVAAVLLMLVAACDRKPADPPPNVNAKPVDPGFIRQPGPAPTLLTYRAPGDGGPDVFRLALIGGVLDFGGPCLRLIDSSGGARTIVTSPESALKRDSMGWFLPSGTDRLRHGATVEGGGGEIPALPPADTLATPVPSACVAGPAVELVGIHRFDPAARNAVPVTPPPPPPPPDRENQ